jgi:hypothetical protein
VGDTWPLANGRCTYVEAVGASCPWGGTVATDRWGIAPVVKWDEVIAIVVGASCPWDGGAIVMTVGASRPW